MPTHETSTPVPEDFPENAFVNFSERAITGPKLTRGGLDRQTKTIRKRIEADKADEVPTSYP